MFVIGFCSFKEKIRKIFYLVQIKRYHFRLVVEPFIIFIIENKQFKRDKIIKLEI